MKFIVIHNWPGQKNSELELIKRIFLISRKLGHECHVCDPFLYPLTTEGDYITGEEALDSRQYDFCLSLHFFNPNYFDTFSYAVNWNPLNYVVRHHVNNHELPLSEVAYRSSCLASHDVLLNAGSDEMDDYAASLNLITQKQIENNNCYLHTTTDEINGLEFPDFQQFRLFYIGINWERHLRLQRHEGLFTLLDDSGLVDFYGLKKQKGILLWEGIKNYKGELPFDGGRSILNHANQCGVSLVMHSSSHLKSGLASTRIFQACAAKTLTICDDNPFVLKHFGDNVLYFKQHKDPRVTFERIMDRIDWIRKNPDQAVRKAQNANQIFRDKFSLRKELTTLFDNHSKILNQYKKELCLLDGNKQIDVLFNYFDGDPKTFHLFLEDLQSQLYVRPCAVIFVAPENAERVLSECNQKGIQCRIFKITGENGSKTVLSGAMVARYLEDNNQQHYFIWYSKCCRWKKTHLALLSRVLENGYSVVVSGIFVKNSVSPRLKQEFYYVCMENAEKCPTGVTLHDIGCFSSDKFPPSVFLFSTDFFCKRKLISALRFFDNGWALFLVAWHYTQEHHLPEFMPKLTTMFIRDDEKWELQPPKNSLQSIEYERALAFTFLKDSPLYYSVHELATLQQDSFLQYLNRSIEKSLAYRPFLLRIYRTICAILKFNKKE